MGFSGASFCAAAIWQYEDMRRLALQNPRWFSRFEKRWGPEEGRSLRQEVEEWIKGDEMTKRNNRGKRQEWRERLNR